MGQTCVLCSIKKPIEDFPIRKLKTGISRRGTCKQCRYQSISKQKQREYCAVYRNKNRERYNEIQANWRDNNREKTRNIQKKHYRLHTHKKIAHARARDAKRLQAMPKWADKNRIDCFYACARFMTNLWGKQYHVDHIVPLRGRNVCGLHIPQNLHVLLAEKNLAKGNKLIEY